MGCLRVAQVDQVDQVALEKWIQFLEKYCFLRVSIICPICFYTVFRHAACCSFPPMALCQDEKPVPGVPFAREASNLLWELRVLGSIRVWHGP